LAVAGSRRQKFAGVTVERQRGCVAHIGAGETDVGELAAVHIGQHPQRRARSDDVERPGRRSARASPNRPQHTIFEGHWIRPFLDQHPP
jgi:hypothetical protein